MEHVDLNPSALLVKIGDKLREGRPKDMKIAAAAQSTGLDQAQISRIENGKYPSLTIVQLVKLMNLYKLDLSDVFGLEGTIINNLNNSQQLLKTPAATFHQTIAQDLEGFKKACEILERTNRYLTERLEKFEK